MHYKSTFLAVAPMVMMARAGVEFDLDETPSQCRDICRPIADLYRSCQVDLRGDDNDREEDQLEVQCFCTNNSFDVGTVAAQCQDCVRQNRGSGSNGGGNRDDDRDDDRDNDRDNDRDDDRDDNRDDNNDNNDDLDDNRDDGRDDDRDNDRDDNNDNNDDQDDNLDDNRTDDRDDDLDNDNDGDNRRVKRDDDWDDNRDDDAWEDINDIVRTCGFTSTSYLASATSAMPSSVSVTATRATDIAQLTTTFTAASAPQTQAPNNDNNNSNNNDNNSNDSNNDDQNGDLNGAGVLVPFGAAGAFVAGAMALLA